MSRIMKALGLSVAALFFAQPVAIADSAEEFKSCARCHGQDGNSTKSSSPSIAGFPAGYISTAMKEYLEGQRECTTMKIKCKIARKWTDESIASAAAHYSQLEFVAREQAFDEALAATGKAVHEEKCASCHSAEGAASADAQPAPALVGQWREYLEHTLGEYARGARPQPDDMQAALESLGDDQREALLNYYASGQ